MNKELEEKRGVPPSPKTQSKTQSNGKAEMAVALGGEAAYAERNIHVSPSGKLTIGDEFRAELRQAFADSQIEGGLDCTLAAMGTDRNKVKIVAQVRRQCTFKRENDNKAAAFTSRKPGGVTRTGRREL